MYFIFDINLDIPTLHLITLVVVQFSIMSGSGVQLGSPELGKKLRSFFKVHFRAVNCWDLCRGIWNDTSD